MLGDHNNQDIETGTERAKERKEEEEEESLMTRMPSSSR